VPKLRAYLAATGGTYIEPFLGGGAIALALGASRMTLGDIEAPLIEVYRELQTGWRKVSERLVAFIAQGTDSTSYARVRSLRPRSASTRAARLLYLNRLCFNGLYRTNRQGDFNVPYGRYANPSFPSADHLRIFSAGLKYSRLVCQDFAETIALAKAGDFVYADPPYHSTAAGFISYHQIPFTESSQIRLADALRSAVRRGAWVLTTNADTEFVRTAYSWASFEVTHERRAINSIPSARGGVPCLLIKAAGNQVLEEREKLSYFSRK
jgi:DNA adenine methylase